MGLTPTLGNPFGHIIERVFRARAFFGKPAQDRIDKPGIGLSLCVFMGKSDSAVHCGMGRRSKTQDFRCTHEQDRLQRAGFWRKTTRQPRLKPCAERAKVTDGRPRYAARKCAVRPGFRTEHIGWLIKRAIVAQEVVDRADSAPARDETGHITCENGLAQPHGPGLELAPHGPPDGTEEGAGA